MRRILLLALVLLWLAPPLFASAAAASVSPPADLDRRVGFDQRLGAQVPMELPLREVDGQSTTLARIAHGKPLLLAIGYYRCPNLCDPMRQGIAQTAGALPLVVGEDYQIVFVGIDPAETAVDAARSRQMLVRSKPAAHVQRWHLLRGDTATVHAIAQAIGYRYFFDPALGQFAHPAGLVILSPQGKTMQYFFGVAFAPEKVREALDQAGHERTGSLIDALVLLCCGYDPATGRHSAFIAVAMQVLGLGFLALMVLAVMRVAKSGTRA